MTPVLIYSHENEPLTKALLESDFDGLQKIPIEALLKDAAIIDEIDANLVKIDWTFSSGLKISNSPDILLINRILSVPEQLFEEFSDEDLSYSLSEFKAYLSFAIEAFPNVFSRPGAFGISGNKYSLPRQWEMIKNGNISLRTPQYYLGNMDFCDLSSDLVYTDPYNFHFWKPNSDSINKENFSFAFMRPKGNPIIGCVMGDEVKIFPYNKAHQVSEKTTALIEKSCLELTFLFEYPIAEILFFEEHNTVSFGMISNIPHASNKNEWFTENIRTYFKKKLRENGKN